MTERKRKFVVGYHVDPNYNIIDTLWLECDGLDDWFYPEGEDDAYHSRKPLHDINTDRAALVTRCIHRLEVANGGLQLSITRSEQSLIRNNANLTLLKSILKEQDA